MIGGGADVNAETELMVIMFLKLALTSVSPLCSPGTHPEYLVGPWSADLLLTLNLTLTTPSKTGSDPSPNPNYKPPGVHTHTHTTLTTSPLVCTHTHTHNPNYKPPGVQVWLRYWQCHKIQVTPRCPLASSSRILTNTLTPIPKQPLPWL